MHNSWEWTLGEEYIEEVKEAWDVVFDYVILKLTFGYRCYVTDKQNDLTAATSENLQTLDTLPE